MATGGARTAGRAARRRARRARIVALAAGAALAVTVAAPAQTRSFGLADGGRIELTPVERMTCPELARKLSEIDATGYRGANPEPHDARDRPLLAYETAVSVRYYGACTEGEGRGLAPSSVFRDGLWSDE